MSAATEDKSYAMKNVQNMERFDHPVKAATKLYGMVALGDDASGYARPLVAGDPFMGFNVGGVVDNTNGAAGDLRVEAAHGMSLELEVVGASITSVGSAVYASDDNTFTLTAGSNTPIGAVAQWISGTKCWVKIMKQTDAAILALGIA